MRRQKRMRLEAMLAATDAMDLGLSEARLDKRSAAGQVRQGVNACGLGKPTHGPRTSCRRRRRRRNTSPPATATTVAKAMIQRSSVAPLPPSGETSNHFSMKSMACLFL